MMGQTTIEFEDVLDLIKSMIDEPYYLCGYSYGKLKLHCSDAKMTEIWMFRFWNGPFNERPIEIKYFPETMKLSANQFKLWAIGQLGIKESPYYLSNDKLCKNIQMYG